ncbi:MAG: pilus assembly protein PilP, partial [Gammaproteobacteria bacterium]|nr:pilus assembly protein PilP [Gammaproteobacteria bacterium]
TLALIRDPSGITHPLAVGDYLGRDHGRIAAIRPLGIDILELVEDGQGGWMARARTLDLNVPRDTEDGSAKTDEGGNEE